MQLSCGCLNPVFYALHLAVCSELLCLSLSHFSLTPGITFHWPASPELSLLSHLLPPAEENPPTIPPTDTPAPTAQALCPVCLVLLPAQPQYEDPGYICQGGTEQQPGDLQGAVHYGSEGGKYLPCSL